MQTQKEITGRYCVEGTEVLRYRISLPFWEEKGMPTEFYQRIADNTRAFCEGSLRLYARREYERSEAPDKRFRFPSFLYTLIVSVTDREDGLLSIRLEASLRRRGRAEPLARSWDAHTWLIERESASLLPPEQAAARLGAAVPSRRQCRRAAGVLREQNAVFLYTDRDRQELPRKKKNQGKTEKVEKL